ncbi:MAG: hypothetical protein IKD35_00115, partial [Clostridia bacterium]|nr:hypothetical protein [Clostridia bacterium]
MSEKPMIKHRFMAIVLLVVVLATALLMTACNNVQPLVIDNPMILSELKPESYDIVLDDTGAIAGFTLKDEKDMPQRTVNYDIPTDADQVKALAYRLYAIGNKTMVTVPYASYYETGTNLSKVNDDSELPLVFNTIDMRNNITGEHFRQTIQTVDSTAEIDPFIQALMGSASESGQRWYVKAGQMNSNFYKTTKFVEVGDGRDCDWTDATVEKSVKGFEEKRKNISISPIPYTASGFQGKINGQNETAKNINGMQWVYDDETGYSIPQYTDGGGRVIGYEKTDQHVFFSLGDDANLYDESNNLVEEDYYNTIKTATVEYNSDGGYYTVHMVIDSDKEYT